MDREGRVNEAAETSEAAKRLQQTIDSARGFGERTIARLKGLGGIDRGSKSGGPADSGDAPASPPTETEDAPSSKDSG